MCVCVCVCVCVNIIPFEARNSLVIRFETKEARPSLKQLATALANLALLDEAWDPSKILPDISKRCKYLPVSVNSFFWEFFENLLSTHLPNYTAPPLIRRS